jgi:C-terminal processing protease CtpA/Prc
VLIDGGTATAAEAFAYDVQQFKLGELVGARTVGAANNNKHVPIAPDFILSVSMAARSTPSANANGEGVGVAPTVDAPPQQALEVAHSLALQRLREKKGVSAENLNDYSGPQPQSKRGYIPSHSRPDRLQSFAGRYATAQVDFRDGILWLSRADRPTLSPVANDC